MNRGTLQGFAQGAKAIAKARRATRPAETSPAPLMHDPDRDCARRRHDNGRIVILPPEGHGEQWRGGGQ